MLSHTPDFMSVDLVIFLSHGSERKFESTNHNFRTTSNIEANAATWIPTTTLNKTAQNVRQKEFHTQSKLLIRKANR